MKNESLYLNKKLQQDHVYVKSEIKPFKELTGIEGRKGYEQVIISEGKVVNVVSNQYGHLPNEKFFAEVEAKLINADIDYKERSINRDNRSFVVDYILNDDRYKVNVKNGEDEITPMLRFVNSYDGTNRTSGSFGFYRKVCKNGLHIAHTEIGFKAKHTGNIIEVVLPEISNLVNLFIENEYYTLTKNFDKMSNKPILDVKDFVKRTADKLGVFQFEASKQNPEPSLNARLVLDVIETESEILGVKPNLWLGYNAFNQVLHEKLKKSFEVQKNLDGKIFNAVLEMA